MGFRIFRGPSAPLDPELIAVIRQRSVIASYTIFAIMIGYYFTAIERGPIQIHEYGLYAGIILIAFARIYFGTHIPQYGLIPIRLFTCLSGLGWGALLINNLILNGGSLLADKITFVSTTLVVGFTGAATTMAVDKKMAYGFLCCTILPPTIATMYYPDTRIMTFLFVTYFFWVMANLKSYIKHFADKKFQLDETRRTAALLRTITDSVPGYVSLFDQNLIYLEANDQLLKALNTTAEQVLGRPLRYLDSDNALIKMIAEYKNSNLPSLSKKLLFSLRPGQQARWYYCTLTRAAGGEIVCVSLDVHDQEMREQLIKDQQEKLVHAKHLAEVGELMGGVAHEINNPLQAIMGTTELLEIGLNTGVSREGPQKHIERLKKYTLRIQKIVASLKKQVRQGDHDPFEGFSIKDVVDEAALILGFKFKQHSVSLEVDIKPDVTVSGRSIQVGQIILNLLNNSIEAIEKNSEKWIRVDAKRVGSMTEIRVTDSGPGIPEEIREKIMEPFFTTKAVGVGTGMGLAICSKIAKEHGGSLRVDTTCKNTCFVLELPAETSAQPVSQEPDSESGGHSDDQRRAA